MIRTFAGLHIKHDFAEWQELYLQHVAWWPRYLRAPAMGCRRPNPQIGMIFEPKGRSLSEWHLIAERRACPICQEFDNSYPFILSAGNKNLFGDRRAGQGGEGEEKDPNRNDPFHLSLQPFESGEAVSFLQ